MKNKYFIWIAAALLLIIGCTKNEIVNEQPTQEVEGRKLMITASVPIESPKTRISLGHQEGGLDIIIKWAVNDQLKFFFKQGNVIKEGTPVTLTQDAISADGKSACFTVNIPVGINTQNAYTLYALHDKLSNDYIVFDQAKGKINVAVFPRPFSPVEELPAPIAGEVEIAAGASVGTIDFEHLGTFHCLTIRNSSENTLTFNSHTSLRAVGANQWYYDYQGENPLMAPLYDLIGKQVANEQEMSFPNMQQQMSPGETRKSVQWVMPKNVNTPMVNLRIATVNMGLGDIYSDNIKPARASALQKGKAYHLFAEWDGTSLFFTDHTFTPTANPLSYVAGYNINPAGNGFVNNLTACNISGYFNYSDAVAQFSNITIGGQRYHLPSFDEWRSIVPYYNSEYWVNYGTNNTYNNKPEFVEVAGNFYSMISDFRNDSANKTTYALRYKGTHLLSAWRYQYIGYGTNNCHLKITSRSVYGQTINVDDITNATFWANNTENDVVRYFPASGNQDLSDRGIGGAFRSSTSGYIMDFRDTYAQSKSGDNNKGFSVRLFTSGN